MPYDQSGAPIIFMTKEQLIEELNNLKKVQMGDDYDPERDHRIADKLLLSYINDSIIEEAFEEIDKWYS